jgi:hypothetical protein
MQEFIGGTVFVIAGLGCLACATFVVSWAIKRAFYDALPREEKLARTPPSAKRALTATAIAIALFFAAFGGCMTAMSPSSFH